MYAGVIACGVRLSNKSAGVKSYHEAFPEARVAELLQYMTEIAFFLRNSRLGSSRLRWEFENAQIHSARRADGAMAVLITSNDPGAAPSIEELLSDFLGVASAAPELPARAA